MSLPITGRTLLKKVRQFHADSLAGRYYAPFAVNSKNWWHIPKETEEWTKQAAKLLEACCQISAQGAYREAATCFELLYELLEAVDRGEEIFYAEEAGTWMVRMEEPKVIKAYLTALAAVARPEKFTAVALLLIRRDGRASWSLNAFSQARRIATSEQRKYLLSEIEKQQIRTGR